ncbi:GlsB/YeaQ/YmgE family stress response membrane protein [Chromohalobacter beijerinckii]|uniref:GlsB/YeaQ/YmgE family stress response membrane protein n=1 Tax=Chromohalobacter beijerinckii TaxID=86179 RepID=A0ABV8XER4_9GAMM|nr:GlsB/YeaQ/YmgE family stress response membrane protein [Chromohalobacter beijerinckii]MCK0765326.1 GlsB/YeaQ/YmgE family stress response membrane protein [Chromohalobacter beijerinckii]
MGIIAWIVFGLLAGIVAKLIMPGRDPGGMIITMIIGILGAIVGGWVGTALGFGTVDGFNFGSFVIAVLGAIILLGLYRIVKK